MESPYINGIEFIGDNVHWFITSARLVHLVVDNLLLTSKQKFPHRIDCLY